MAKQTKATKTSESTPTPISTPTPTPIPTIQSASAPAPVDKEKVKKVKAVKQPSVSVSVSGSVSVTEQTVAQVAPVVVEVAPVSQKVVVEETEESDNSLADKSASFYTTLQQVGTLMNALKSEYKAFEKLVFRNLKLAAKQSAKKKKRLGTRAPSGFVKPTRISDELAQFLEQPLGSEMARTEVTKCINQYIRQNNLQDKSNGRHIIPDAKLSVLLQIPKGEELTYFNLQRFMSRHFAKSKAVSTTATATATA